MTHKSKPFRSGSAPDAPQADVPAPTRLIWPVLLAMVIGLVAIMAIWVLSMGEIDNKARAHQTRAATALIAAYADKGSAAVMTALKSIGLEDVHIATEADKRPDMVILPIQSSEGLRLGAVAFTTDHPALSTFRARFLPRAGLVLIIFSVIAALLLRLHLVSRKFEARQRIKREMARTDSLSGLANRRQFESQLGAILAEGADKDRITALYFIDLDSFKRVNDTYGHAAGDHLISLVSERLKAQSEPGDVVARLSGDEFALVRPNTDTAQTAEATANALLAAFSVPFVLSEHRVHVSASIGLALSDQLLAPEAEDLCQAADTALRAAKEKGRNQAVLFSCKLTGHCGPDQSETWSRPAGTYVA